MLFIIGLMTGFGVTALIALATGYFKKTSRIDGSTIEITPHYKAYGKPGPKRAPKFHDDQKAVEIERSSN